MAVSSRLWYDPRMGEGDWMVVEADESDGTFLKLPAEWPWSPTSIPSISITTARSTGFARLSGSSSRMYRFTGRCDVP